MQPSWCLPSMSSPELSGQGGASFHSLFGLSSRKEKKKGLSTIAPGSVGGRSDIPLPHLDIWYTHLGTSPSISDPLIARSLTPQSWFFEHQMFFLSFYVTMSLSTV